MPTSNSQKQTFAALKKNKHNNECWINFLEEWEGFIRAIISRKLFFAVSLWDDALLETEAKIFRYIEGFDESREISPWLSRVIHSACEDVKKQNGYKPIRKAKTEEVKHENESDFINRESFINEKDEKWLAVLSVSENAESKLFEDMWCCINYELSKLHTDERKKSAFILFYRYDFKLKEIAKLFEISQTTANNWPGSILKKILPNVKRSMKELGYKDN